MLPNFLVIGAPRCGTSWIDANLRTHPDVFMPYPKELHFFDRDYEKGIQFYEQYFSSWKGQRAVGEATPAYLHGLYSERDIPILIHQHLPDVKLIVSLRNPVERAYSHFLNVKAKHEHNVGLTFEQKLQKVRGGAEIVKEGFYAEQLRRYYALFPAERILVLLYDDMVKDPRAFLRSIYEFLGVDASFEAKALTAKINMATGKKHLGKSKMLWMLARALTKLGAHELSERVRIVNSVPQPAMNAETRQMLFDIYKEKNLDLQALIQRDLSAWDMSASLDGRPDAARGAFLQEA